MYRVFLIRRNGALSEVVSTIDPRSGQPCAGPGNNFLPMPVHVDCSCHRTALNTGATLLKGDIHPFVGTVSLRSKTASMNDVSSRLDLAAVDL